MQYLQDNQLCYGWSMVDFNNIFQGYYIGAEAFDCSCTCASEATKSSQQRKLFLIEINL